jgi:hypothetical protein
VKNRSLLDREKRSKYEFVVKAMNKNSSVHATVICHITILDVNDNRPEFLQSEYKFYAPEKDSNVVDSLLIVDNSMKSSSFHSNPLPMNYVGNVRAIDRDYNTELFYYIDSGNENYKAYFELNTANLENPMLENRDDFYPSASDSSGEMVQIDDPAADSNVYDLDDLVFSDNTVYEVTAIRHVRPMQNKLKDDGQSSYLDEFEFKYMNDTHMSGRKSRKPILGAKKKVI